MVAVLGGRGVSPMSAQTRLVRLLDRGFYPVELPPPFATRRFSNIRSSFAPADSYSGGTTFFDGATFRGHLRTFGVINPVNYFLLSRFIADKWNDIVAVLNLSSCSGARPKFPALAESGRAIRSATLASKRKGQAHLASVYPVIVDLDINRFYGSIYTHSIPWAVLGKERAKSMLAAKALNGHWSDKLDRFTRNCNQTQTVGIPIGPDTSRIISELILSRIDAEMTRTGSGLTSAQIYHNIDDYQIGSFETSAAENAQSLFVRTIARYELRLNDFKTCIRHGMDFHPANFQRYFDVLSNESGKNFVEHLFELIYKLHSSYPDNNIVGYALKWFAKPLARSPEQDLVREYLQRLIYAAPHHARWVFPLLLGIYKSIGATTEIRRLIQWGIEVCCRRNDVGSLLWFIYAALFLEIRLRSKDCNPCMGVSSGLVDVMLYHGRSKGLFSFDISAMRRRYLSAELGSNAWLPLYEVERRAWDTTAAFQKFGADQENGPLYKHLRDNDVEFYLTDDFRFSVSAFFGWKLKQTDFDEADLDPFELEFDTEGFGDYELETYF